MLAFILLCGISLVAGQQPRPCETPAQWEGKLARVDYSKNFTQFAKISYDETDRRVREVEELEIGSTREFYDVLYLHNVNKEYRLNLATRKCNVTALTRPFRHFGFPPDARFIGEGSLGPVNIPNEHATIISFEGKSSEDNAGYIGSVTFPDCIPVNNAYFSNTTGVVHTTFFDITLGIPDPSVFEPPHECQG